MLTPTRRWALIALIGLGFAPSMQAEWTDSQGISCAYDYSGDYPEESLVVFFSKAPYQNAFKCVNQGSPLSRWMFSCSDQYTDPSNSFSFDADVVSVELRMDPLPFEGELCKTVKEAFNLRVPEPGG